MTTWYGVGPCTCSRKTASEDWMHGSFLNIRNFSTEGDPHDEINYEKHWNVHLGAHFTSNHDTAEYFAQAHGQGDEGHVHHVSLDLRNPKHYDSEHDMDEEAFHHGVSKGYLDPIHAKGYQDAPHIEPGDYHSLIQNHARDPGEPGYRHEHPGNYQTALSFKQHLIDQGHDGITYGNEVEAPKGHKCAIAFHDDQINVTHTHHVDEPCTKHEDDPDEREDKKPYQPAPIPGQQKLDFGKVASLDLTEFFKQAADEHDVHYHLTDNPNFSLNKDHEPTDNAVAINDRSGRKGLYVAPKDKVDSWWSAAGEGYSRPYVAEIHTPKGTAQPERWGGEHFIPAEHFDKAKVHRVIPWDAHIRERYKDFGHIESHHGTTFDTGEKIKTNDWGLPEHGQVAEDYKYTGDTRTMKPEEQQRHQQRWQDYMKEDRGWSDDDFQKEGSAPNYNEKGRQDHYRFQGHEPAEGQHAIFRGVFLGHQTEEKQRSTDPEDVLSHIQEHGRKHLERHGVDPEHERMNNYGSHWTTDPTTAHKFSLDPQHGKWRSVRHHSKYPAVGAVLELHTTEEPDTSLSQYGESELNGLPKRSQITRAWLHVHRYDPQLKASNYNEDHETPESWPDDFKDKISQPKEVPYHKQNTLLHTTEIPVPHAKQAARSILANDDDSYLPPEPGTQPIPEGHIRLYHYTRPEHLQSIKEHGLLHSRARGDSGNGDLTDPSAGVWASTKPPKDAPNFVEFHAHPDEISDRANSPRRMSPEEFQEGNHHVIMRGDVKPDQFVAIHKQWHNHARYILDSPDALEVTKRGENDGAREVSEDYRKAIDHVKKHGGGPLIFYPAKHGGKYHLTDSLSETARCRGSVEVDKSGDPIHIAPDQERIHPIVCKRCLDSGRAAQGQGKHVSGSLAEGYTFTHGKTYADMPRVDAVHPEHGVVGTAIFDDDGSLADIQVHPDHQRKGLATGMWNHAKEIGLNPQHSNVRTETGDAWAKSTGDEVPENVYPYKADEGADSVENHRFSTAFTAPGYHHPYTSDDYAEALGLQRKNPHQAALHNITYPERDYSDWSADDDTKAERDAAHQQKMDQFHKQVKQETGLPEDSKPHELHSAWERGIRHGLTKGHITVEDAEKQGYHGDGREHGEKYRDYDENDNPVEKRRGGWQNLAANSSHYFHVSTDADSASQEGLKTRHEQNHRGASTGLGGGSDDTVSVTDDGDLPHDIYHSLHEHHAVLTGKITPQQLHDYAKNPPHGMTPFHHSIVKPGSPEEGNFDRLKRGVISNHNDYVPEDKGPQTFMSKSKAAVDHPGWTPVEESRVKGMEKQEAEGREPEYTHWERPATHEEHTRKLSEFYKRFSHSRDMTGKGHRDPLFMSNNPIKFAQSDPEKFGIMTLKPHPKAQGYPLSADRNHHQYADSGEWRLGSGSPFDVTHVEKPYPRHLEEFENYPAEKKSDHGTVASIADTSDGCHCASCNSLGMIPPGSDCVANKTKSDLGKAGSLDLVGFFTPTG